MHFRTPCLLPIALLATVTGLSSLLPAQQTTAWVDLFDGQTLNGWQQRSGTSTYRVEDKAIVGRSTKGSPNSFLCTERFYGDFELQFETKLLHNKLNSGVQIRSNSHPGYGKGRVHGYQVEVATNGDAGFIYDENRSGWVSKNRRDAAKRAAFKAGQWNHFRIHCQGDRIQTWINDVSIADARDSQAANGFIGLQIHSMGGDAIAEVAWRNIRIREIGNGGGWSQLFNGKDLSGWKVNENPGSVRVSDGALVVGGKRAHVFYDGPIYAHSFKNFEFHAQVKTLPKANSGIYFHTQFQQGGWPSLGYECQVNNSQGDWRRTGGLYAIEDVRTPPAKDNEWFDMDITVRGKHITVAVNGKVTADYTEPANAERPKNMAGRLLSRGTFAFQCHDPGSVVHYKDVRVKPLPEANAQTNPNTVVWEGKSGPGQGKHIVFIAGDHEYRGEETLPGLARILAKRYGFKCTFIVTTNRATGEIEPGSNHITNLQTLKTADLMVVALRFQHFADEQMQHIEDYLNSGRPVLGLRTSTHGFQGLKGKFAKYNEGYKGDGDNWRFGFGEQILGEHWVGHFGRNHRQSSRVLLEAAQKSHPILRGVQNAHAVSGGYVGHPKTGSITLARGQVLDGMKLDSPPTKNEKQQVQHSVAWVRNYQAGNPKSRVFASTHGASEDILNEGYRRMLINAHLWCLAMDDSIKTDNPVGFVGPYNPATYSFGGYRKGVKPSDIAGYDSPIYDAEKTTSKPTKKRSKGKQKKD